MSGLVLIGGAMVGRIVLLLVALVFLGLMAFAEAATPEIR